MRRTWETASSVDHFGLYANCIGSKVGGREDLTWSLISLSKTFMAAEVRAPDRSVVIQACRRVDPRYSDNCGSLEAGRYNRCSQREVEYGGEDRSSLDGEGLKQSPRYAVRSSSSLCIHSQQSLAHVVFLHGD